MQNAESLNRNFLLHAREAAKESWGALSTGLPPEMLKRIGAMSNEEIDQAAQLLPVSMFTLRVDSSVFERVLEMGKAKPGAAASYLTSVLAK